MKSDGSYDVIVLGVGSMGSATCYALAKRGYKVLGIEQFDIPHQNGSHTGQSRLIRKAYFEHPDYVPLLESAYTNWKEFEIATRKQFYFPTGLLYFGLPENGLISGVRQSAKQYQIPLEELSHNEQKSQFPQFDLPVKYNAVFEPAAGFITPEKAIHSFMGEAKKLGAEIHSNEKVIEWKKDGDSMYVRTVKNTYRAQKLVITAGPWASNFIPALKQRMKITRQLLAWVQPTKSADYILGDFPCWGIEDESIPGLFYGFPIMPESSHFGETGLKVAHHIQGEEINPEEKEQFDERTELEKLRTVLDRYLPGAFGEVLQVKSCLYTNTPDSDFILDRLPGLEDQVSIACGFSGHGFKFVPLIGEIMADLTIDGQTDHPIDFLSARRFYD